MVDRIFERVDEHGDGECLSQISDSLKCFMNDSKGLCQAAVMALWDDKGNVCSNKRKFCVMAVQWSSSPYHHFVNSDDVADGHAVLCYIAVSLYVKDKS